MKVFNGRKWTRIWMTMGPIVLILSLTINTKGLLALDCMVKDGSFLLDDANITTCSGDTCYRRHFNGTDYMGCGNASANDLCAEEKFNRNLFAGCLRFKGESPDESKRGVICCCWRGDKCNLDLSPTDFLTQNLSSWENPNLNASWTPGGLQPGMNESGMMQNAMVMMSSSTEESPSKDEKEEQEEPTAEPERDESGMIVNTTVLNVTSMWSNGNMTIPMMSSTTVKKILRPTLSTLLTNLTTNLTVMPEADPTSEPEPKLFNTTTNAAATEPESTNASSSTEPEPTQTSAVMMNKTMMSPTASSASEPEPTTSNMSSTMMSMNNGSMVPLSTMSSSTSKNMSATSSSMDDDDERDGKSSNGSFNNKMMMANSTNMTTTTTTPAPLSEMSPSAVSLEITLESTSTSSAPKQSSSSAEAEKSRTAPSSYFRNELPQVYMLMVCFTVTLGSNLCI